MAALPANSTDRYFFHYTTGANNHTVAVRTAPGLAYATIEGALESLLTLLTTFFAVSAGLNVDFQAAGTDFTVPVATGDWGTFGWGDTAATVEVDSQAMNFQGRSADGHKSRMGIFGYNNLLSGYRVTGSEDGNIEGAVGILNSTVGGFLAIGGLQPNWYSYVNIKANDHWVREARA